jgi:hypothetical protein
MLILATPTNPGTASWTPMSSVGGTLIFSAFAPVDDSANGTTTDYTPLPGAEITIPANTVQDGDILVLNLYWTVDNSASLNPATLRLGVQMSIVGPSVSYLTTTAPGTIDNHALSSQPAYFGEILGPSNVLVFGQVVGASQDFSLYASNPVPLTQSFAVFGLLLDYTQPIPVTPGFQMDTINADTVVSASLLSVQIYRP